MMRVWVTRDEDEQGPLSSELRAVGLVPITEPVQRIRVTGDARDSISRLGADDWLVLTSQRAIDAVAIEPARVPKVAVVEQHSAERAARRGMRVEFISRTGDASGLWPAIAELARGRRVCFPRSALANVPGESAIPVLHDIDFDAPVIYEVEPRAFDRTAADRADITAFASPSAVRAVHRSLGHLPVRVASIGPRTSEAIRELTDDSCGPVVQAAVPTFAALAEAILRLRDEFA